MKYRSREELVYKILKTLSENGSSLKTHLMYDARLSYAQLKEYQVYLENNKLIEITGTIWKITAEGRKMFTVLDKVFSFKVGS